MRKRFPGSMKRGNFLVVWKLSVQAFDLRIDFTARHFARNDSRKETAAVTDEHNLLRAAKSAKKLLLDRFGRNIVTGIQNYQILEPPGDAPVSIHVHFALIAGVEPSSAQHLRRLLGPVPIARKNIRTTNDNFAVLANFHFDAGNCRADTPGIDVARVVHGANCRGLSQSVYLEHRDSEHQEE